LVILSVGQYKVKPAVIEKSGFVKSDDTVRINNVEINVDVADTPAKEALGLGGRESLKEGEGMWFVFSRADAYGFWMKDMKFPIDIIWLDENSKILTIASAVAPETFPKVFYPSGDALYVLEVPANFAEKSHFQIGDKAEVHP
jgi:uncharacterized membrane protein (UPF0127 family)